MILTELRTKSQMSGQEINLEGDTQYLSLPWVSLRESLNGRKGQRAHGYSSDLVDTSAPYSDKCIGALHKRCEIKI